MGKRGFEGLEEASPEVGVAARIEIVTHVIDGIAEKESHLRDLGIAMLGARRVVAVVALLSHLSEEFANVDH